MSNFSKRDRACLAEGFEFQTLVRRQHQSASDGTQKLLLGLKRNGAEGPEATTECVMIPARNKRGERRTACISSQVGCPVGCRFCASGLGGLEANLTAGQIVEQVWHLNRMLEEIRGPKVTVTNVVFMGMGEPLSNFAAVTSAIRTLCDGRAFGISARKVTVSTVGVPAPIRRLAEQVQLPVTLAISLHAPNDELRRQLIPWAESTRIDAILEAAEFYFKQTGREVTFEYILLGDVNDGPHQSAELAKILRPLRCTVNLIRYNEVAGLPYQRPATDRVRAFQKRLVEAGINTHIRASRGRDIAAACGQLRHEMQSS